MDAALNIENSPMMQAGMAMSSSYNLGLVALSVVIAVLASYTALDLAGRVTAAKGQLRKAWLTGGAIAMGIGIWSMHFVGMLAFSLPMPMKYSVIVVLISMLVAIIASFGALYLVSQPVLTRPQLLIGGVLMGFGIAGMHYIGMLAMRMEANIGYDWLLFGLSIAIAIGASIAALWIAFVLRTTTSKGWNWRKIASAPIMGAAISGMHYTGMAAAKFTPTATAASFVAHPETDSPWLAIGIGIATLVILGFALISSFVEQRMAAQTRLLQQQELEAKRTQLFSDVTLRIRQSLNLQEILKTTVREVRKALHTDRVVVYRFESDWKGTVVAESVAAGWTQALEEQIDDPCFREHQAKKYQEGRVHAIDNIYLAGLSDCYINTLERYEVKANLVAPILKSNKLLGLLIAHHCSGPRNWQQPEIDLFRQLALQVGFAIDQAELLEQQEAAAKRTQLFTEITLRIRESLNFEDILKTAVKEVRKVLQTDRVVIYRFGSDWKGSIVAESVAPGWTQAVNEQIYDPCFKEHHIAYEKGRVVATNDIYQAGFTDCYIKLLKRFEVKANIVAPILKNNQLLGLLIANQCSSPRDWQQHEIDLFKQLAIQIGFALDQATLLEQVETARQVAEAVSIEQRQQKEALQHQLVELLSEVEAASRGDLTVRAEVSAGEIGTVADFFNAIIESLRQIVTQVQKAATQVNISVGENEGAIRQLADEALQQAQETIRTLDSVEQMTHSIGAVADNARLAAAVAGTAFTTAKAGGVAMDRTVESIFSLRETVAQTAKKVKQLGESSQQISKVVSLINQIALQTNVLAINASIEAARAGEEGRGFAVVAEEVGQLAAQSSAATKEIEQIVENIQLETSAVVKAMELGTQQVIEGTHLVKDAKACLGQILDVSRQIDQLVQSISTATVSQAETSGAVASLMKEIALASERTYDSSRRVSKSLQQTVEVARQLQASVGVFQVEAQD